MSPTRKAETLRLSLLLLDVTRYFPGGDVDTSDANEQKETFDFLGQTLVLKDSGSVRNIPREAGRSFHSMFKTFLL